MIKLKIDADGYDLSDDLRSRIEDRIGGLDEYMDTLTDGRVTVSWEGGKNEQAMVRAEVWGGGNNFDGSDTEWKAEKAIDQTREKLSSQIRRKHSKDLRSHDQHRE